MNTADRVIRWSTAVAVLGVAAVAAAASCEDGCDLVRAHGEAGWTARLVPLTVDGLVCASSMVMLDSARGGMPVPALARWLWLVCACLRWVTVVLGGRVSQVGEGGWLGGVVVSGRRLGSPAGS